MFTQFSLYSQLKASYTGIIICVITAIAASTLAAHYQAPVMLFALLLGLAMHFLYESTPHQIGIDICATSFLRIAVGLLGVRISFSDIASLGLTAPLIVISAMALTIAFGVLMAKALGLSKAFGALTGGSVAVCGVSAAAAISTVLPKKDNNKEYFAITVIGITTLSTIAMITYPIFAKLLGFDDTLAGVFTGGSVHDVAQVVGAGYSISSEAGDIATYIKLLRVALLLPIVMLIFFCFKGRTNSDVENGVSGSFTRFVPSFLIVFFVLALTNNLGFIPQSVVNLIQQVSNALLVVAIVAIGVRTSLKQVVSVGWKPIFLLTSETVFLAVLIILGIVFFM